jgi:hypothetical protein
VTEQLATKQTLACVATETESKQRVSMLTKDKVHAYFPAIVLLGSRRWCLLKSRFKDLYPPAAIIFQMCVHSSDGITWTYKWTAEVGHVSRALKTNCQTKQWLT